MKILATDFRKGFFKAKIENLDDLWYLTYIIEKSDIIKAKTFRKIKLGGEDDRNKKIIKKVTYLAIEVEKFEFSKYSNVLRVNGTIKEGPEDIPLGSFHTINLEEGTEFKLIKKNFLKYQIDKLKESAKESNHKILIVVHDREVAYFALLKKYGYELITQIKGNAQKKTDVKTEVNDLFPMIKKLIEDFDKQHDLSNIIIASPGFWREYVQKLLKNNKKVVYATCSSVGINGINEVLRRPEVQTVLKQERFASETKKVEELLEQISKEGKSEYGLKNVIKVTELGAVEQLLVTDGIIHKMRQDDNFNKLERLMRKVEAMNGQIHIISSEHVAGNQLDGLGGVGAILRYKT
jgi:protein pelota